MNRFGAAAILLVLLQVPAVVIAVLPVQADGYDVDDCGSALRPQHIARTAFTTDTQAEADFVYRCRAAIYERRADALLASEFGLVLAAAAGAVVVRRSEVRV